jgi:hypothetical protein
MSQVKRSRNPQVDILQNGKPRQNPNVFIWERSAIEPEGLKTPQ